MGLKFHHGAGSRTRTYEARRREIYSLLSLPLDDSSTLLIITNITQIVNQIIKKLPRNAIIYSMKNPTQPKKSRKALIFDIDNTLIELRDEFVSSLGKVVKEMGYDYSDTLISDIYKRTYDHEDHYPKLIKSELLEYINTTCHTNLSLEFVDRLELRQSENVYDDPDLVKVIQYLSQNYDLYAVSNWFTKTQSLRLERMGVLKYFKKIYGADINYYKPNLKTFDVILKDYPRENCISIGDSLENDIKLPISLGMQALWKTKIKSTEYQTFQDLTDLIELL